jgi:CDP-diglyceride synthetase
VDDVPDGRDDDVTDSDDAAPRPEFTGPVTDRIRIVGAEPAGEATSVVPAVTRQDPSPDDEQSAGGWDQGSGGGGDERFGESSVRLTGEPGEADAETVVSPVVPGQTAVPSSGLPPTELPHWTEPPTGQVPAVLARDSADDTGSTIGGPSWREEDADWVAHDEEFEPAMFGDDAAALGSLDESDGFDAVRRPWEFDLESSPPLPTGTGRRSLGDADEGPAPTIEPITEPVAAVGPLAGGSGGSGGSGGPGDAGVQGDLPLAGAEAGGEVLFATRRTIDRETVRSDDLTAEKTTEKWGEPPVVVAAAGPTAAGGPTPAGEPGTPTGADRPPGQEEEFFDTSPARPTGTPRVGRARRNGLLPARLRAKRPEDTEVPTDTPLAAEPPGAEVTEVPGVARRRGGVAGLAAADRDAALAEPDSSTGLAGAPSIRDVDMAATAAVAAGVAPRRPRRQGPPDRPTGRRGSEGGPTGGGPPPTPDRSPSESKRSARNQPTGSSIGLRVGTGLAAAVVALLAFKVGTVTSLVLCVIVVTFAAGECFSVLRRAGYHPATLLGLVGTISLMIGAYDKGVAALPLVLIMLTAFTFIWFMCGIESGSPVAGTAATLLTVGWVALFGVYSALLLSPSLFPDRHGIAFLLGAIIATVANDVGALAVGSWLGRHPLAPSISPNKTWEGLVGGTIVTLAVSAAVVGLIHPWTPSRALLLGVVVSVVAPIGDLAESLLKRDLRLKDMGTLLPGHGGVLDRVDALLFVLPATYYLVRALNIG